MLKYLLLWFPMLLLAVLNGAFRESVIVPKTSPGMAHRISTLTLLLLFAAYFYVLARTVPPASGKQALQAGLMWLLLTLAFEFGFGRYRGLSWEQMLMEYNIFAGKLWILVPISVTVGFWAMHKILYG